MNRPTYVYRIVVDHLPDEPSLTSQRDIDSYELDDWRWPRVRSYLSERAAHRRAQLIRFYGGQAHVERSEQVVWDGDDTPRDEDDE